MTAFRPAMRQFSAVVFTLLSISKAFAQATPAPDGSKLGDWIDLDNKVAYTKLRKDLPGYAGGPLNASPGALATSATPTEPVKAKAEAPKPVPPTMIALYGLTSKEGDQFRGLLQWNGRVYAIRVGGYVKQWRVKKISERGAILASSNGRELFAPLDVDSGAVVTPVSRAVPMPRPTAQPMAQPMSQPVQQPPLADQVSPSVAAASPALPAIR